MSPASPGRSVIGPAVAGTWYPKDREELERQVDGLLARAAAPPEEPTDSRLLALVAPHAGFVYSGEVAAAGFRAVGRGAFRRVLLLGPSHYASFEGARVPAASFYRTPLGDVPLDVEAVATLARAPGFGVDDGPFGPEHALEAEIPFLERRLAPGWQLVPVLVGHPGLRYDASVLAPALLPLLDPHTLVVVSSDFTHYGPRFDYVPFEDDVPQHLSELDRGAIDRMLAGDGRGFDDYVKKTGATICGRNPIRVLLDLLPATAYGRLLAYDTSGRITGDFGHSVSYASIVFHAGAA